MTYECECSNCDLSEYEARITDPVPDKCPDCGSRGFKRLISQSKFVLLGNCWASDGYGKR